MFRNNIAKALLAVALIVTLLVPTAFTVQANIPSLPAREYDVAHGTTRTFTVEVGGSVQPLSWDLVNPAAWPASIFPTMAPADRSFTFTHNAVLTAPLTVSVRANLGSPAFASLPFYFTLMPETGGGFSDYFTTDIRRWMAPHQGGSINVNVSSPMVQLGGDNFPAGFWHAIAHAPPDGFNTLTGYYYTPSPETTPSPGWLHAIGNGTVTLQAPANNTGFVRGGFTQFTRPNTTPGFMFSETFMVETIQLAHAPTPCDGNCFLEVIYPSSFPRHERVHFRVNSNTNWNMFLFQQSGSPDFSPVAGSNTVSFGFTFGNAGSRFGVVSTCECQIVYVSSVRMTG